MDQVDWGQYAPSRRKNQAEVLNPVLPRRTQSGLSAYFLCFLCLLWCFFPCLETDALPGAAWASGMTSGEQANAARVRTRMGFFIELIKTAVVLIVHSLSCSSAGLTH